MDALVSKFSWAVAGLLGGLGMAQGQAASFDCARASTQVEYAICGNPALSALDEELSRTYRQALALDPQVRGLQLAWLRGPREKCSANVVCLIGTYKQQLEALREVSGSAQSLGAQGVSRPAVTPVQPVLAADNPIALLFDPKLFYTSAGLLSESAWSSPQTKLFGKPIGQWNDADFDYLKYRLEQQIQAELQEAGAWNTQHNLQHDPNQDSTYRLRADALNKVIESIPRFKYWIAQANAEQRLKQQAQQQQVLVEQQAQIAREQAHAQAVAEQQQQVVAREHSQARVQYVFWIGLIMAAVLGGYVWHRFFRARCPACNTLDFDCTGQAELDRYKGRVKVREKNSRGTNTRYMSTTFVHNRYDYQCNGCNHVWSEKRKEELGM